MKHMARHSGNMKTAITTILLLTFAKFCFLARMPMQRLQTFFKAQTVDRLITKLRKYPVYPKFHRRIGP